MHTCLLLHCKCAALDLTCLTHITLTTFLYATTHSGCRMHESSTAYIQLHIEAIVHPRTANGTSRTTEHCHFKLCCNSGWLYSFKSSTSCRYRVKCYTSAFKSALPAYRCTSQLVRLSCKPLHLEGGPEGAPLSSAPASARPTWTCIAFLVMLSCQTQRL